VDLAVEDLLVPVPELRVLGDAALEHDVCRTCGGPAACVESSRAFAGLDHLDLAVEPADLGEGRRQPVDLDAEVAGLVRIVARHCADCRRYHRGMAIEPLQRLLQQAFPDATELHVEDRTGGGTTSR
jgi:hypothetical protein